MKPSDSRLRQLILESPATITFFLSLLLSFIARFPKVTVNRDGMRYTETAQIFIEQGLEAALKSFDWIFYPALIGIFGYVTGLPYEAAGHVLGALLLAGACAIMVKQVQVFMPGQGWMACLIVLSIPAMNSGRDEILRENGYWLFMLLSCWLATRTPTRGQLLHLLAPTAALGCAALFRVEAVAFYPALVLWQWYALGKNRTLRNSLYLFLPLLVLAVAAVAILLFDIIDLRRIQSYWHSVSPANLIERFETHAEKMAQAALSHYIHDEASIVLFCGLLGLLGVVYLGHLGILVVPLAYALARRKEKTFSLQPFGWLFLTYACVAVAFITSRFFISDRYITLLGILSIPLIVFGSSLLWKQFPRWRTLFAGVLIAISLSNVISLTPEKTHFIDTGLWLKEQQLPREKLFIEDSRIAYYAGWGSRSSPGTRDQAYKNSQYSHLAIIIQDKSDTWLHGKDLRQLARFSHQNKESIVILMKE